MKATRTTPPFSPVILTLESQAEVDVLFALLNDARFSQEAGLPDELRADLRRALVPFASYSSQAWVPPMQFRAAAPPDHEAAPPPF